MSDLFIADSRKIYKWYYENKSKEVSNMLKKLGKILCCVGDIAYVGLGGVVIYYGTKLSKWAINELETDLKH